MEDFQEVGNADFPQLPRQIVSFFSVLGITVRKLSLIYPTTVLPPEQAARERGRQMEARDAERRRNMAILQQQKALENAEIRKIMDKRHEDALAAWHRMIKKKEDDYLAKQAVSFYDFGGELVFSPSWI